MYVTENGCAYATAPSSDGKIRDEKRSAFLRGHIAAVADACEEGLPLRGYFLWSLLDNYEWAFGYEKRFGSSGSTMRPSSAPPRRAPVFTAR